MTAAVGLAGCLTVPPDGSDPPDEGVGGDDPFADAGGDAGGGWLTLDLVPSGPAIATAPVGGTGGGPYQVACPDDRFVTGLGGRFNGFGLSAVRARCSRFRVALGDDAVELVDTVDGEEVLGDPDSVTLEPVDCSPGLVAVGYAGSVNSNDVVGHLQLRCALLGWNGTMATVGAASEDTALLGEVDEARIGDGLCESGLAGAGIAGRFGLLIDRFQLDCFALEVRPDQ